MPKKSQYPKRRHDSAGTCDCGWPLDKFGQCTDPNGCVYADQADQASTAALYGAASTAAFS